MNIIRMHSVRSRRLYCKLHSRDSPVVVSEIERSSGFRLRLPGFLCIIIRLVFGTTILNFAFHIWRRHTSSRLYHKMIIPYFVTQNSSQITASTNRNQLYECTYTHVEPFMIMMQGNQAKRKAPWGQYRIHFSCCQENRKSVRGADPRPKSVLPVITSVHLLIG